MENLDRREWLLTNGLGSFACGTACDARTRTYHGWLIAALNPPSDRTLLLSHLEATLEIAGKTWQLGTNFWSDGEISPLGYQLLRSFTIEPIPTWVWSDENWQLTRQLEMPNRFPKSGEELVNYQFDQKTVIQYIYQGQETAILRLKPLIADRNFHHQQTATPELKFSQKVSQNRVLFQARNQDWQGATWQLTWSKGNYQIAEYWYWNYYYPEEELRGLGDREDLWCPGELTINLQPGDRIVLEAKLGWADEQGRINSTTSTIPSPQSPVPSPQSPILNQLLRAADRFIVYRQSISGPTVIAGYPWFNDWGRDTLIALPGLALTTGRFEIAKGLLQTFGSYCKYGLIPNTFPDQGNEPFYNSIDASLWWIETLGLYLEATEDWDFLVTQYPVFRQIYKAFVAGTLFNIHIDAIDGLLTWDAPNVAITWMDVVINGKPITPRYGKPVEINALWYSALCWAIKWAEKLSTMQSANSEKLLGQRDRYFEKAEQVKKSLQKYWNPEQQYFYDTISPDDQPDPKIRPNAVLALSSYHCGFPPEQARQVLEIAKEKLLTPYGLRSLAPDDSDYIGFYTGDSLHRDSAYHQGTVWSWLIGCFINAWQRFYQTEPLPFDWQPMLEHFQNQACLGSVSEIFDGDPPHTPQGAFAQAWSVAEVLRYFPK
ncbi:amylo-alpha-1,6-glucosidase [[Phormidium ambiguum] IAM M-71]|uniref:Amylo-alpha-1,6-glucosidase n=1 Tax=[Phormidium ambiguum] IAM M-71 TaxID=454136 RepID=A0A1U7IHI9_9CYAN|nr:amylo-alpha-1,6-glucosidase [Phormidium ambiguum]OKH36602.1 amylo-alpha-1,6-glucosidase [Phormidium ambiguum IAM M-71]